MPITVVTDTDVAALPYHGKGYSFRLDKNNKGPFAAMVPLSHLLDPAKKEDCTSQLAGQFAAIPMDSMRNNFLLDKGAHYVLQAIAKAGDAPAMVKTVETLLDRYLADPAAMARSANEGERDIARQIELFYVPSYNPPPKNGMEIIASIAQRNGTDLEAAGETIRTMLTFMRPSPAKYFNAIHDSPDIALVRAQGRKQAMREALASVPEALCMPLVQAIDAGEPKPIAEALAQVLGAHLSQASAAQKDALLASITEQADRHKISEPMRFDIHLTGKSMEYTLEEIRTAANLKQDPLKAAQEHYVAMREAAVSAGVQPKKKVADFMPQVQAVLAATPGYIVDCAQDQHMKMVIVDDKVDINDITPNHSGLMLFSKTLGGATGQGIYAAASLLKHPIVLREEMVHEVERNIVPKGEKRTCFTTQDSWMKALVRDTADAARRPLYKEVLTKACAVIDAQLGNGKGNRALVPLGKPMVIGKERNFDTLEPFMEALPDMLHVEAYINEIIARKGRIKIGGGLMGFGGQTFRNTDELMQELFSNAWPLVNGPKPGMKLVQNDAGEVKQIAASAHAPAGMKEELSLREHCVASRRATNKGDAAMDRVSVEDRMKPMRSSWKLDIGPVASRRGTPGFLVR